MKSCKYLLLTLFIACFLVVSFHSSSHAARGRILLSEPDGSPNKKPVYEIQVPNGTLSEAGGVGSVSVEPTQTAASQVEAEAGTEAGIRSWSPLRIFQAIASWWNTTGRLAPGAIGGETPASGEFTDIGVGATDALLSGARLAAVRTPYGVQWNETADTYRRLGLALPAVAVATKPSDSLLPIQTKMRRCLLLDNGTVNYYTCPTNTALKADCATASDLTGTDGQVMVEIPAFCQRYGYVTPNHNWEIAEPYSDLSCPTGFTLHTAFVKDGVNVAYRYVGAYEGVLYDTSASRYADGIYQTAWSCTFATSDDSITANTRTAPFKNLSVGDKITISGTVSNNTTVTVATLVSDVKITVTENLTDETAANTVIQTQKDWTATTGDILSSVSGKTAITYGTRAQFRVAASNRGSGWRQLDYDLHSAIQLLYFIEYASFYSQSMIGAGITAVTDWAAYNDSNPIAKSGNGNAIGNASGNTAGSTTCAAEVSDYMSYRGIENWYGHLWKWCDGININSNVPYVSNTATQWADDTATNYTALGITLHNADGYQATLEQISRGFLPASVGASSSTKITDYYYQVSGWRVVRVGGNAIYGGNAGGFVLYAVDSSADANRHVGGRVCF